MLEQIIQWGGDTDSVAAITWGIASARYKDNSFIPEFMVRDLEGGNADTGATYLIALGTRLMEKFTASSFKVSFLC